MLLRLLQCTRQHSCPQHIIIWLSVNSAEVEKPCSKDKYTQNEKSQISLQNYKLQLFHLTHERQLLTD